MQATVSDRKLQTKCPYRESWDITHIILMSIKKMLKIHGKEYTNKYSPYLQTKADKLSCSVDALLYSDSVRKVVFVVLFCI